MVNIMYIRNKHAKYSSFQMIFLYAVLKGLLFFFFFFFSCYSSAIEVTSILLGEDSVKPLKQIGLDS